mmetsp:Transcript_15399/g.18675  ORF Transcript_15399/g.18675 Transcript_15399/m.18675 type:complete len:373 (+) Transcript_15399:268-1386(+)
MGNRISRERQERAINRKINEILSSDRIDENMLLKMFFVGLPKSGAFEFYTTLEYLSCCNGDNEKEKIFRERLLKAISLEEYLIRNMQKLVGCDPNNLIQSQDYVEELCSWNLTTRLDLANINTLLRIWGDKGTKTLWMGRYQYQIPVDEMLGHVMNLVKLHLSLEKVKEEIPYELIIRLTNAPRSKSQAVQDIVAKKFFGNTSFRLVHIGDLNAFENPVFLSQGFCDLGPTVYFVNAAAYDESYYVHGELVRVHDMALEDFRTIANHYLTAHERKNFLVLTNVDVFVEKFKTVPYKFENRWGESRNLDFNGEEAEEALEHLCNLFADVIPGGDEFYRHYSNSSSSNLCKRIFSAIAHRATHFVFVTPGFLEW